MLQTCRFSFPHSRIGLLGFGTDLQEFLENMFRIWLIGFECWSEDRLGVEDDVIWQMCVKAFAMASHI